MRPIRDINHTDCNPQTITRADRDAQTIYSKGVDSRDNPHQDQPIRGNEDPIENPSSPFHLVEVETAPECNKKDQKTGSTEGMVIQG